MELRQSKFHVRSLPSTSMDVSKLSVNTHVSRDTGAQGSSAGQSQSVGEAHIGSVTRSWLRWEAGAERAAMREAARQRLATVLETYTDVTRFPR